MPAATLPPPAGYMDSFLLDEEKLPQAQGAEGRGIQASAKEAVMHWQSRPSYALAANEADAYSYESPPLRIIGTVRVKYRPIGRLPPSPYPSDS